MPNPNPEPFEKVAVRALAAKAAARALGEDNDAKLFGSLCDAVLRALDRIEELERELDPAGWKAWHRELVGALDLEVVERRATLKSARNLRTQLAAAQAARREDARLWERGWNAYAGIVQPGRSSPEIWRLMDAERDRDLAALDAGREGE